MRGFTTELKVGLFAVTVIAILAFMTFQVGEFKWTKKKGYTIYIYFDNIAGLDEKTKVKVAGVDAGTIERIDLVQGRAKITLRIYPDIKLYEDSVASIKATGLLGDKFLDIRVGPSVSPLLRDGDTIKNVREFVDMDDLARNVLKISRSFSQLSETLNEIIGTEENRDALAQIIENLQKISLSMNESIQANDQKLRMVLDNINSLTASLNSLLERSREPFSDTLANMKEFSESMKTGAPELLESLNKTAKDLESLVSESRPRITSTVESLDSITQQIEKGEGSLGKLVKDDQLYESVSGAAEKLNKTLSAVERFKTYLTFRAEYLSEPGDGKGYFYVTLQPRKDKYYILGVVGDPVGKVTETETTLTPPGTTVKEEEVETDIEFTAQIARRFGDAAIRFGLTESTFGAGGDYYFLNDRGRITADIWDFSADEEDADDPHVKIGVDYFLFKNLFISAGIDNLLNERWRGGYVGMGLRFEDEDFKYLLGTLPWSSVK